MSVRDEEDATQIQDVNDGIDVYVNAGIRAKKRLEAFGVAFPSHPPIIKKGVYFDGHLPSNVNSLTARELGEIYSMMCNYCDYISGVTIRAKNETINANERLSLIRAHIRKEKSGTAQSKEDATICDIRYLDANAEWLEAQELFELLQSREEAARRDLRVLSRLIETRKMDLEIGQREGGMGRGAARPNRRFE